MEWALTVPLFLILVVLCGSGIFQISMEPRVNNAAREAARSYSLGANQEKIESIVRSNVGSDANLSISKENDQATVTVTKPGEGVFKYLNINFSATHVVVIEPSFESGH